MCQKLILFFLFSGVLLTGMHCCPYRYATVSIESVDSTSGNGVSVYAFSGEDGSYLGQTNPLYLHYKRRANHCGLTASFIVSDKSRGIPIYWQIFKVTRWAHSQALSMDATYLNRCLFIVKNR